MIAVDEVITIDRSLIMYTILGRLDPEALIGHCDPGSRCVRYGSYRSYGGLCWGEL